MKGRNGQFHNLEYSNISQQLIEQLALKYQYLEKILKTLSNTLTYYF